MDLAFGYNKNTDNLGLDNSEFNDTYSVGFGYETYIGDVVLSLGGGFEKAISDTDFRSKLFDNGSLNCEKI